MSYLKGLGERINNKEEQFTQFIEIEKLIPSKENFYGIRDIEELAESIKENGLLHNLVVRKMLDGMYEILSGERRYSALKLLGYSKIPCKLVDLDNIDSQILLIQANARQRELTPIEKMNGISKLKALYDYKREKGLPLPKGKTRDLIGDDLGISGSQVAKYQAVEKNLISPLKDKLNDGDITLTQATILSGLKEEEQQVIHEQIKEITSKESKDEVDILVKGIKQPITRKQGIQLLEEMYPTEEQKEDVDTLVKEPQQSVTIIDNIKPVQELPELKPDLMYLNLEKMLAYDSFPKLVLDVMGIESILYTASITIRATDNTNIQHELSIKLSGLGRDNIIKIPLSRFEKVDKIPNGLQPKIAYKIHNGAYLWFKRKDG